MQFTLLDFFIGFFVMNAMPHLLFGLLKIRFFSPFGYSAKGNIGYTFLNLLIALVLFHIRYGLSEVSNHGVLLGAIAMIIIYLITGKFFYTLFNKDAARSNHPTQSP